MHRQFDGTLKHQHDKAHIPHSFAVPDGTTAISITLDYACESQAVVPPQISLSLFDPAGARGTRHNNGDQSIRLTQSTASPGYMPRAIRPGEWTVWIDVHRLLEPDVMTYSIKVELSAAPTDEAPVAVTRTPPTPRGRGWYRGDLHAHSLHSDARFEVAELVQFARDYHLDFVTLTDHNTASGLAEFDSLATDDVLTMGGVELTTYYGHALALGVREWQEWRVGLEGLTMSELARRVIDGGALYVIAHPTSVGDPWCTGCDWQFADMQPGSARHIEIWNESWGGMGRNEHALALWYQWLNEGYRMTATVGTDLHAPLTDPRPGFNVVYADELSEQAIYAGLRQGHSYVSAGPRLEFTATSDRGAQAMMGDVLAGEVLDITVMWSQAEMGARVRLIEDGQIADEQGIPAEGQRAWRRISGRWYVIEIRAADGDLLAATNPIFRGTAADWR